MFYYVKLKFFTEKKNIQSNISCSQIKLLTVKGNELTATDLWEIPYESFQILYTFFLQGLGEESKKRTAFRIVEDQDTLYVYK